MRTTPSLLLLALALAGWAAPSGCVGLAGAPGDGGQAGGTAPSGGGTAQGGGAGGGAAGGGATGGGLAQGGGTATDAGHLDFDAGPPDTRCLADAGLTALEQAIVGLPADSWLELPGSDFAAFCEAHQDPGTFGGCAAAVTAWSGAAFDDEHRQLLVFGGGHGDYDGNEVYAFSLATGQWSLARAPTPMTGHQPTEPMYDGTPVSRHTYGGLAWLADVKRLLVFGGSTAPVGSSADTVWLFDPATASWTRRADGPGTAAGHFFDATAYDPVAHRLYLRDEQGLWEYDAPGDAWTHVLDFGYPPWYPLFQTYAYRSAVLLPARGVFLALGDVKSDGTPDVVVYETSTRKDVTAAWPMTGDTSVIAHPAPGLAWHPGLDALVAWADGAPGVMSLDSRVWQRGSGVHAPARDPDVSGGTFGRFRYVAYLNAFVLVSSARGNVFVYKLTSGC